MARRESIELFLAPHEVKSTQSKAKPNPSKLFLLTVISSLALLWGAFLLLPSERRHHHHTTQRSNNTLLPFSMNERGNWTVPLPTLPLTPETMRTSCDAVHHHVHGHRRYYWVDTDFVDPTAGGEAELVYSLMAAAGYAQGLAESLLEVFSAYGLSVDEKRHFRIDDSDWPWGGWEDYFLPPPLSSPSTATPSSMPIPCPRHAHSLIAGHTTRTYIFGHAFSEHFERPRFSGSRRQQKIFSLAAAGHAALFRLQPELEAEARQRIRTLTSQGGAGSWVAVHVRRGDFKPHTWAWHKTVVPLEVFVDATVELSAGEGRVVVISDDASVPAAPQLAGSFAAQGSQRRGGMNGGYRLETLLGMEIAERVAVGREFVVQLRVVAGLAARGGAEKGGVVCAAGSTTCRLLAVMVGWDKSVEAGRWKDIDGGMGWRGVDW